MTGAGRPGPPPRESPEGPAPRRLLVGIGAPDRGDDAVGPAVVALVTGRVPRDGRTRVLTRSDPSHLVEEMAGADLVVIVDAVRTGAAAGTVHLRETGAGQPPLPGDWSSVAGGSHGFGLGHALELARALDRLPARVVLVGVEGTSFEVGTTPSDAVRDAVVPAACAVLAALGLAAPPC